jgi:hypothetical protein
MPPGELERIGELLVEEGVVTQEELSRALAEGNLKATALGQILEASGHVRRAELAAFLAAKFRLPVVDDLRKQDLFVDAAKLIPEEIARKHEAIPIARVGDVLCVAKSNYYNRAAVQEMRKVSGLKIKVLQADEAQVRAAIEAVYRGKKGDLPPPGKRKETGLRPSTTRIPVQQPAGVGGSTDVPLISMPENGNAQAGSHDDLNEVIEVLDAIKIPSHEFQSALKDPLARLAIEFDDVFHQGRPAAPVRMT